VGRPYMSGRGGLAPSELMSTLLQGARWTYSCTPSNTRRFTIFYFTHTRVLLYFFLSF
jgi:hypothetical protein